MIGTLLAIAGVVAVVFVITTIAVVLAIAAGASGDDLADFYQAHPSPLLERQRLADRHAALVEQAETNLVRARRLQADIENIPRV